MNIVIPMAGAGQRFVDAGYKYPKPFIFFNRKTMIENVIENMGYHNNYVLIMQSQHAKDFKHVLESINDKLPIPMTILTVDQKTQGAAETCLMAQGHVSDDDPLVIANCDQMFEWNQSEFEHAIANNDMDGYIFTFTATRNPLGYSYALTNEQGLVIQTAEKQKISEHATTGIYVWKRASDYWRAAQSMIQKDIRVNNEFYVCPVFNQNILQGQRIGIWPIEKHWGIGTPEDLEIYLNKDNK